MAGSDEYYYVARLSGAVRRDGCWPALFVTPSADYAESWYASSAGIAWHNCALEQGAVPGEVAATLSMTTSIFMSMSINTCYRRLFIS